MVAVVRVNWPATVVWMPTNSPKGRNKRCSDQIWVGGVPTKSGELVWVLRGDQVVRVRSRRQLGVVPENAVVAPRGAVPAAAWFSNESGATPEGSWRAPTSRALARSGTSRRRGRSMAAATSSANPLVRGRIRVGGAVLRSTIEPKTQEVVGSVARAIEARGGRALVVGGAVRDMVYADLTKRALVSKDADIEVYGITPFELMELLGHVGRVDETGADFAVLKLSVPGLSEPLDISMPRRERATGTSHRDFAVSVDSSMSFSEAASRRDFTIGAMGYDPLTHELLDPYGGAADLASGVLRHVSDAFDEDPLRALRAARFAARFDLTLHPDTKDRCIKLAPLGETLAVERRWGELAMSFSQASKPGEALRVLKDIEWLYLFAGVADLVGVEQDPGWHPEGDVFIHTAAALDYWGQNLKGRGEDDDLVIATAIMCHDFGKAATTKWVDDRWRALGHEEAGVGPARALLEEYHQSSLADRVAPLIANHLAPMSLGPNASASALRRLATRVPRIDLLCAVARADVAGRPPLDPSARLAEIDAFEAKVNDLGVARGAVKPLAKGDTLISLGMKPGPIFSTLLKEAYEVQIEGGITSSAEADTWLRARVAKGV